MTDATPSGPRNIEKTMEIDAPVEAVWAALTDAEELANWFPLKARVKPGVGGSVWAYWADDMQWESPIDVWEPNKHLRVVWCRAGEHGDFKVPFEVAVDYHLQARGGKTVLRLIHSGFSPDASWDTQYDGTVRGWNFELLGLKHYLERHRGRRRVVVNARRRIDGSFADAWAQITGPNGIAAAGRLDGLQPGDRLALTTATGRRLEGRIEILDPPKDLAAIVENLGDAYLRLRVDMACHTQPQPEVNLWLSTYGLDEATVRELQADADRLLAGLFAEAGT